MVRKHSYFLTNVIIMLRLYVLKEKDSYPSKFESTAYLRQKMLISRPSFITIMHFWNCLFSTLATHIKYIYHFILSSYFMAEDWLELENDIPYQQFFCCLKYFIALLPNQ